MNLIALVPFLICVLPWAGAVTTLLTPRVASAIGRWQHEPEQVRHAHLWVALLAPLLCALLVIAPTPLVLRLGSITAEGRGGLGAWLDLRLDAFSLLFIGLVSGAVGLSLVLGAALPPSRRDPAAWRAAGILVLFAGAVGVFSAGSLTLLLASLEVALLATVALTLAAGPTLRAGFRPALIQLGLTQTAFILMTTQVLILHRAAGASDLAGLSGILRWIDPSTTQRAVRLLWASSLLLAWAPVPLLLRQGLMPERVLSTVAVQLAGGGLVSCYLLYRFTHGLLGVQFALPGALAKGLLPVTALSLVAAFILALVMRRPYARLALVAAAAWSAALMAAAFPPWGVLAGVVLAALIALLTAQGTFSAWSVADPGAAPISRKRTATALLSAQAAALVIFVVLARLLLPALGALGLR